MNEKIPCRLCKSNNTSTIPLKGLLLDEYDVVCRNCGHQFQIIIEEEEKPVDIEP